MGRTAAGVYIVKLQESVLKIFTMGGHFCEGFVQRNLRTYVAAGNKRDVTIAWQGVYACQPAD